MSNPKRLLIVGLAAVVVAAGAYSVLRKSPEPMPVVEEQAETAVPAELVVPTGADIAIAIVGQANGVIAIDLFEDTAPKHAERIKALAASGAYDNVVFHRVIEGFMAQTGDVEFGQMGGDMSRAGMGASDQPDLPAEFSELAFDRGVVGMARSQNPNSANSQFFIMLAAGHFLNGQYTVVGKVVAGMDIVDTIKLGKGQNGAVIGQPDMMQKMIVAE